MIIVQLTGGLGNQLFQYAMGRTLAVKNKSEFKIDISFFEDYEWHDYSLEPFNIYKSIATKEDVDKLKFQQEKFDKASDIITRLKRRLKIIKPILINEANLLYNAEYKLISNPAYLKGYWQCEEYFIDFESLIRKELQIIIPPSEKNKHLLNEIDNSQAVSLHIRRGNFAQIDYVNKVHGTCSMEYYEATITQIASHCSKPVFYIFSDDIPWAKENLNLPFQHVFVDINDDKTDYEDLRLMYHCKHHILANSTFSWWGAWLNYSRDKKVIAPKQWFADDEKNKQSLTIIPKDWIRI